MFNDGWASLQDDAEVGDHFEVLDDSGTWVESVWVEGADLLDGLSEADVESRLGNCTFKAE